jgi:hypothetical protein
MEFPSRFERTDEKRVDSILRGCGERNMGGASGESWLLLGYPEIRGLVGVLPKSNVVVMATNEFIS